MTVTTYEITEAEWPDDVPASKKAVLDFIASGKKIAEIKADKSFLLNVRRAINSDENLKSKVEVKMADNRMFIRRKEDGTT